ncbi:hypothetical protein Gpo141_00002710 [Globisporangium polare]
MSREAAAATAPTLSRSPSSSSFSDERAQLAAFESRVEADRAVFAKSASIRRLSAVPIPAFDCKSSNQDLASALSALATHRGSVVRKTSNVSSAAIATTSPLVRRPSTAASAHSRVHQALHRSESEFVFSSKEATVDGFLYSSRFDHLDRLNSSAAASSSPLQPLFRQRLAKVSKKPGRKTLATTATANTEGGELRPVGSTVDLSSGATGSDLQSTSTEHQSISPKQQRRRRAISGEVSQQQAGGLLLVDPKVSGFKQKQGHPADELSITQRKRRCAKTFEEMILARLNNETTPGSLEHSMAKLLGHGMIQSVLELSAIADAATQSHCCRALYYLSRVPSARKPMVAQGVVGTIKALSRITAPRPRQDLAATLCHLSEENGLVEVLLFEGIDQSLSRMFTAASSYETKRICALAVFNISVDALTIKHFGDAFSQLLVFSTRSSGGNAASGNLIKAVYNASLVPAFHASLLSENIPRFLLHQLPHVQPAIQILALRALVALCDSKANRALMLSQGFCKLLKAMLASTNEDIQETTLTILLLLSIDDGSRIKLCNWVPASTIVQAASQHVENLSDTATLGAVEQGDRLVYLQSCVLRNLCDSVLTHHELVEEGAVRVLLQMSRMEDSDVKSNAICALCCIIASSTDEAAGYVPEITAELLALTRTQQSKNLAFAVGALYNIACSDDCLPLLAESPQLLERMLELASEAQPTVVQENVAALVAAILYRLSSIEDHQEKMLQHGVFPVLVHLIHRFPSGRTFAVNALYLLAQDGGEHFPHGGDEVAKLAIALSEQGKQPQSGTSSPTKTRSSGVLEDPTTTLRSAVTLLAHLARHPKNQSALVRNGAVFRFLRRLKRLEGEETILINCAFVYFSLTATQEGCEQLIKELGVEDIIHMSRSSKLATHSNQQVKELCILALCRLSAFIGLESKLIEHGAIDAVMIMALVTTDSPLIKALCIKTLANCLVAKNCVRPLIDHGVIWALASLAQVDTPETRYACAVSLCNLSAVTNMLSRFLDAGAPRALIHLLRQSSNDSSSSATLMTTIKAIANLVANEKICAVFLNEELDKHLSVHFADPSSSEELRQLAAMVLLRVTSANDAMISREHLKHGVFVWMEQIIIMKEADLVRNCMLTVHDLTCNSSIDVGELDVEHILRIVIQVFARHQQNDEVVTLCLSIVYNLSCQRTVLPRLVIPEIMGFLRQHVPIGGVGSETKNLSFKRISSGISSSLSGKLSLVSAAASMLSAASAMTTDVKLCCLILHNLSCHHSSSSSPLAVGSQTELLASLVNFRAVAMLNDVYVARDDLKEICAIATCNLVVAKVNSSRVLEDHAGDLLVHFISSNFFRASHYLLVSAALRKLVNAPGNQQTLLEAGVVRAMVFMLGLSEIGHEASLNLAAALALLSKCSDHLSKLLDDGVLPSVIRIAETKTTPGDLLSYCFEILSNVCAVNFEEHMKNHPEINVISTLTKLSEHHFHHQTSSVMPLSGSQARTPISSAKASPGSYCDRGDGTALGTPQLLTFMIKSPSNAASLKKNLELHATYTVPARKWVPDPAQAVPKDPPPLECNEIPLTETSQSIPLDVKQRIRSLVALPKEALVRDESADDSAAVNSSNHTGSSCNLLGDSAATSSLSDALMDRDALPSAFRKLSAPPPGGGGSKKKLQRGLAGRNLSQSALPQSRSGLLFLG